MNTIDNINQKFELPKLKYDTASLEPFMGQKTVEIHHGKHHAGYVKKLNEGIQNTSIENSSLEEILKNVSHYSHAIRNNAGGHYNHTIFWELLTPENTNPSRELVNELEDKFESLEKFKETFKEKALQQFGSGWAWLILNNNGELEICTTPNQDNPVMDDAEINGYPLIALDVWEHAYYLDYQNSRANYIESFWKILDWQAVNKRFEKSKTKIKEYS